jgi:hypothetical protein
MDGHGDRPRTKNRPALAGHVVEAVRDAIADAISTLPEQLRHGHLARRRVLIRSLTWALAPTRGANAERSGFPS